MNRLEQRMLILTRQCGNLAGDISFYTRTPEEDIQKRKAHKFHMMCDVGDLLLQTKMIIKDLGFNEDEVLSLAFDRYDECKKEFTSKGKGQYFI